ncbi:MAG TPA: TetR/AcrR family transcriptional regulator [Gammaproteobacteria bacterium]
MDYASAATVARERIKQERGRKTYDALISTAFKLLADREFDSITVAELSQAAGYSVGAFYARFKSKDELFDALIAHHMAERTRRREKLFATLPEEVWIREIIADIVNYYWKRRRFWRAALIRSIHDPDFWQPLREHSHELASSFIQRISREAGRPLTDEEQMNVRFAIQITLGTINNTIINRPGPIFMGQSSFVEQLARAFRLVAGYDDIVRRKRKKTKRRGTATSR